MEIIRERVQIVFQHDKFSCLFIIIKSSYVKKTYLEKGILLDCSAVQQMKIEDKNVYIVMVKTIIFFDT